MAVLVCSCQRVVQVAVTAAFGHEWHFAGKKGLIGGSALKSAARILGRLVSRGLGASFDVVDGALSDPGVDHRSRNQRPRRSSHHVGRCLWTVTGTAHKAGDHDVHN